MTRHLLFLLYWASINRMRQQASVLICQVLLCSAVTEHFSQVTFRGFDSTSSELFSFSSYITLMSKFSDWELLHGVFLMVVEKNLQKNVTVQCKFTVCYSGISKLSSFFSLSILLCYCYHSLDYFFPYFWPILQSQTHPLEKMHRSLRIQ